MIKNKILLLLTCTLMATGCSSLHAGTSAVHTPDAPSTVVVQKQDTPAQPTQTQAQSPKTEVTTAKRYYVDPKNFLIRPVDRTSKEKIALLTLDDGPKGDTTLQILDILDQYHVKAIWFVSGFNYGPEFRADPKKAKRFEDLVREIKKRGHIIANHTWTHSDLKTLPVDVQRKEIDSMNDLLEKITGEKPKYFRPPFGSYTDVMKEEVKKQGMQWMNWSVGSLDWEYTDPKKIVHQTVSTIYNGANILMHDNDVEVQALSDTLKQLQEQGYHFVLPTEVNTE